MPILSICIPTYNRAKYLENTLNTIVTQKRFYETYDVEIVIANNGSRDETEEISKNFMKIFPDKIRYYHYNQNSPKNMLLCLELGNAKYVKLNNDTLMHKENSLDKMLSILEHITENDRFVCFCNGNATVHTSQTCSTVDSFISSVSYFCTWIPIYTFLKKDIDSFDFNRKWETLIPQVDFAFRLINSNRKAVIDNSLIFDSVTPSKKGGYDILKIFLDQYLWILKEQADNSKLSKSTYKEEKRNLLKNFILPWLIELQINGNKYTFSAKNRFKKINWHYKDDILYLIKFYYRNFKILFIKSNKPLVKLHRYFMLSFNLLNRFNLYRWFKKKIRSAIHLIYNKMKLIIDSENESSLNNIKYQFLEVGNNFRIGKNPTIKNPKYIKIGENFSTSDRFRIEAWDEYEGEKFTPVIEIGNNVIFNTDIHIGCINKIQIGNNCLFASRIYITDHHHGDTSMEMSRIPPSKRPLVSKGPVIIEDNVWIGEGVAIMPNITIGENSIVATNAVVTKDIPRNSVAAGVPAKIIKTINHSHGN